MTIKNSPVQWAIKISSLLKSLEEIHGISRIPVNVMNIAKEYSKQVCPSEPITSIEGEKFSNNFDGVLIPKLNNSNDKEWKILYNNTISYQGRINFTLAHEFGHYLLHRASNPKGLYCNFNDMLDWESRERQQEQEANVFASYLLMPLDDFREQLNRKEITLEAIYHLSNRYNVSLSAVILKWLSYTKKRAMMVVTKDGFIDWAWSNKPLIRSGIFYRARQDVIEVPSQSLAAKQTMQKEVLHHAGVWPGNEEVRELIIRSQKDNISISLLIYPDIAYFNDNEDVLLKEINF